MTLHVVTDGREWYEVTPEWGHFPSSLSRGRVSQVAALEDGRVVLVQRENPAVLVFGDDGQLEASWHHEALDSVHGITVAPDGTLWLTSWDMHQVLNFTIDGTLLHELGERNWPSWGAPFNHPTDAVAAKSGDVYVADGYGNACMHRFSADGRLLQTWGDLGDGAGQFTTPHGVWIDETRDRIIVTDRDNNRVCQYSKDGQWLGEWRGFQHPMSIWSDGDAIWVTDQRPSLWRIDLKNDEIVGRCRLFSFSPHGLSGTRRGLFIADQGPDGITFLRRLEPGEVSTRKLTINV